MGDQSHSKVRANQTNWRKTQPIIRHEQEQVEWVRAIPFTHRIRYVCVLPSRGVKGTSWRRTTPFAGELRQLSISIPMNEQVDSCHYFFFQKVMDVSYTLRHMHYWWIWLQNRFPDSKWKTSVAFRSEASLTANIPSVNTFSLSPQIVVVESSILKRKQTGWLTHGQVALKSTSLRLPGEVLCKDTDPGLWAQSRSSDHCSNMFCKFIFILQPLFYRLFGIVCYLSNCLFHCWLKCLFPKWFHSSKPRNGNICWCYTFLPSTTWGTVLVELWLKRKSDVYLNMTVKYVTIWTE